MSKNVLNLFGQRAKYEMHTFPLPTTLPKKQITKISGPILTFQPF